MVDFEHIENTNKRVFLQFIAYYKDIESTVDLKSSSIYDYLDDFLNQRDYTIKWSSITDSYEAFFSKKRLIVRSQDIDYCYEKTLQDLDKEIIKAEHSFDIKYNIKELIKSCSSESAKGHDTTHDPIDFIAKWLH